MRETVDSNQKDTSFKSGDVYADLLDPDADHSHLTVEGAAVRPEPAEPGKLISADEAIQIEAARVMPSRDQVRSEITRLRKEAPTEDQLDYIMDAKKRGIHLS